MNDENFEMLLKEALAPEVSADELQIQRKGGKTGWWKRKSIAIAAACAILAVGIGSVRDRLVRSGDSRSAAVSGAASAQTDAAVSHLFTIEAMAAETNTAGGAALLASSGDFIPLVNAGSDHTHSYYEMNIPLTCVGEDVYSVTYHADSGRFKAVAREKVKEGTAFSFNITDDGESLLTGSFPASAGDGIPGGSYQKSFSVINADSESDETKYLFFICGYSDATLETAGDYYHGDADPALRAAALNRILGGASVSYEVTFTDKTTASGTLDFSAKAETYLEAGQAEEGDENAGTEDVFIVVRDRR